MSRSGSQNLHTLIITFDCREKMYTIDCGCLEHAQQIANSCSVSQGAAATADINAFAQKYAMDIIDCLDKRIYDDYKKNLYALLKECQVDLSAYQNIFEGNSDDDEMRTYENYLEFQITRFIVAANPYYLWRLY